MDSTQHWLKGNILILSHSRNIFCTIEVTKLSWVWVLGFVCLFWGPHPGWLHFVVTHCAISLVPGLCFNMKTKVYFPNQFLLSNILSNVWNTTRLSSNSGIGTKEKKIAIQKLSNIVMIIHLWYHNKFWQFIKTPQNTNLIYSSSTWLAKLSSLRAKLFKVTSFYFK